MKISATLIVAAAAVLLFDSAVVSAKGRQNMRMRRHHDPDSARQCNDIKSRMEQRSLLIELLEEEVETKNSVLAGKVAAWEEGRLEAEKEILTMECENNNVRNLRLRGSQNRSVNGGGQGHGYMYGDGDCNENCDNQRLSLKGDGDGEDRGRGRGRVGGNSLFSIFSCGDEEEALAIVSAIQDSSDLDDTNEPAMHLMNILNILVEDC